MKYTLSLPVFLNLGLQLGFGDPQNTCGGLKVKVIIGLLFLYNTQVLRLVTTQYCRKNTIQLSIRFVPNRILKQFWRDRNM